MTRVDKDQHELRGDSVSFNGALEQSLAHVRPSAATALFVVVVVGATGTTSWLTFIFAAVIMLFVEICISHVSVRVSKTGRLYGVVNKSAWSRLCVVTACLRLLFRSVTEMFPLSSICQTSS